MRTNGKKPQMPARRSLICSTIQDGINAHQLAIDHKVVEQTVTKDSVISIKMVDEGGFVCRIEPIR